MPFRVYMPRHQNLHKVPVESSQQNCKPTDSESARVGERESGQQPTIAELSIRAIRSNQVD